MCLLKDFYTSLLLLLLLLVVDIFQLKAGCHVLSIILSLFYCNSDTQFLLANIFMKLMLM